jgi:hypothetical protein
VVTLVWSSPNRHWTMLACAPSVSAKTPVARRLQASCRPSRVRNYVSHSYKAWHIDAGLQLYLHFFAQNPSLGFQQPSSHLLNFTLLCVGGCRGRLGAQSSSSYVYTHVSWGSKCCSTLNTHNCIWQCRADLQQCHDSFVLTRLLTFTDLHNNSYHLSSLAHP